MMWGWAPWWHWLWMAAGWLVLLGLAVAASAWLFPRAPRRHDDAREVLDGRLVRGELDVDEYRRLCSELERR